MKNCFLLISLLLTQILTFSQDYKQNILDAAEIYFPGKPNIVDTNTIKVVTYSTDSATYMVICADARNFDIKFGPNELQTIYRGSIDGTLKSLKGNLTSQKQIKVEGLDAMEIEADYPKDLKGNNSLLQRFIVFNNKMISYGVFTPYKGLIHHKQESFFKSFKIVIDKKDIKQYNSYVNVSKTYEISYHIGEFIGYTIALIFIALIIYLIIRVIKRRS